MSARTTANNDDDDDDKTTKTMLTYASDVPDVEPMWTGGGLMALRY
jgi:hypothetical protein